MITNNDFRQFIIETIDKEIGTEEYEVETDAEPQGDSWLSNCSTHKAITAFEKVAAHAFAEGRKQGLKEMYTAVSENFNVSQFANKETLKLMSEFSH